jgi:hypothetical protein
MIDLASWTGSAWRFGRHDGSLINPAIRFQADGKVAGHSNPNEKTWLFEKGWPTLIDESGTVTTRFDSIEIRSSGQRVLRGRFAATEIIHVLEEQTPHSDYRALARPPRVAVLVRSHVATPKLLDLLASLRGSSMFDVYLSVDVTNGPFPLRAANLLPHDVRRCIDLGLYQRDVPHYLWFFCDYPFYCALQDIPQYDYYMQIEYDVHITRRNPLFLEGLINRLVTPQGAALDLAGIYFGPRSLEWTWSERAILRFPTVYGVLYPFVLVSRKALDKLLELRRDEARGDLAITDAIHGEAFTASALANDRAFVCVDVNDVINGAYIGETFRVGLPMLLGATPASTEMMHPVMDEEAYIGKHIGMAAHRGDPAILLRAADDPLIPMAVQGRLLEAADKSPQAR